MTLKKTIKELKHLLECCTVDLKKTEKGFKTAAQRLRVNTVKLAKVSLKFRRESIEEKEFFDKVKTAQRKVKNDLKAKWERLAQEKPKVNASKLAK